MASASIKMLGMTGNNAASDECYTPASAVLPLLKYLDKGTEWYEATSGASKSIVHALRGNGFKCSETDGDFFGEVDLRGGVVTNPPYSKKDAFLRKCYDSGLPFALLLPVSSLQGQRRGAMFKEHGLDLLVLNDRVDFTGKGAPHFGVAWFTLGILPERLIFRNQKGE